jgi:acetyl esterase/lipase
VRGRVEWEESVEAVNATLEEIVTTFKLGDRQAERVSATPDPDGTLLLLHGGGFTSGSLVTHRALAAALARASRWDTIVLDYRLAPEHPFPAALDDAVAAYNALIADGVPPDRLAVVGDSAGTALVVALLVAVRDEGVALPAAAILLSPWLDMTLSGDSIDTLAAIDPMVTRAALQHAADLYLDGGDAADPRASPLFADLRDLPPFLIHSGEREILRDDTVRFAERVNAAGGSARPKIWPGMWHVFHAFAGEPSAASAIEEIADFLHARTDS